jgi:hypothetical protein
MLRAKQINLLNHMVRREGKKQDSDTGIDEFGAQFKLVLYITCRFCINKQA